jgi:hypothetical protein
MARATRSCKAVSRQSDSFGIPCRENGCEHGAPAVPAENALLDTQSIQDADQDLGAVFYRYRPPKWIRLTHARWIH